MDVFSTTWNLEKTQADSAEHSNQKNPRKQDGTRCHHAHTYTYFHSWVQKKKNTKPDRERGAQITRTRLFLVYRPHSREPAIIHHAHQRRISATRAHACA